MKSIARWALPLLLIGALATPGFAQAQAPAQAKPEEPGWNSTKEYEDYMAVYNEQKDLVKKAANAEKFFIDHKNAHPTYLTNMYIMMFRSYVNSQNWAKVAETYERMSIAPKVPDAEKKLYTQVTLIAYTNLKNNPKTLELAEKALKEDPNNFNALITLSNLLSQSLPTTEPGKTPALTRTLEITKRGLAQPRPADYTDAQWNSIQLQLLQTSCMVLLNQQKYSDSIAECQNALKINPKDSYAWYLIGMSLKVDLADKAAKYRKSVDNFNDVRLTASQIELDDLKEIIQANEKVAEDKKAETLDAFARSAAAGGPIAPQAREEIQKITQNPAETNRLIEEKKGQLGN